MDRIINEQFTVKNWLALIGLSLLAFTAFLDFTIINAGLPKIQVALDTSIVQLQWVTSLYEMMLVLFMVLMGHLADRFGRRRLFYSGIGIFFFAALGAGLAKHIQQLIIFRALQGLGAAAMYPVALALLAEVIPKAAYPRAVSIYSAITGAGLALGPLLGGVIIQYLSWRWIFFINLPIILLGYLIASLGIPRHASKSPASQASHPPFDYLGLSLLVCGLACTVYGVIEGAQQHFQHWPALLLTTLGICLLISLFKVETKVAYPIFHLEVFSNPALALATITQIVGGSVSTVMIFFDPLYLSHSLQLSAFKLGLYLTAIPCMQVVISLIFYRLIRLLSVETICLVSTCIAYVAVLGHSFFHSHTSLLWILGNFMLIGICWGIANTAPVILVHKHCETGKTANALGTLFTMWNLGGTLLLSLTVALFSMWHDHLYRLPWQNPSPTFSSLQQAGQTAITMSHGSVLNQSLQVVCWFILILLSIAVFCSIRLHKRCKAMQSPPDAESASLEEEISYVL